MSGLKEYARCTHCGYLSLSASELHTCEKAAPRTMTVDEAAALIESQYIQGELTMPGVRAILEAVLREGEERVMRGLDYGGDDD